MNINLLISKTFPGRLVVPYPAIWNNSFWIFLASTHIWVGVITQRWKTWRWSSQIPLLLLEPWISISMLLAQSLCSAPTFCTSGYRSITSTDPIPKQFSSLSSLCLSSPRMLPEDGQWRRPTPCSLQPALEGRNMFSAEHCRKRTHFVSVLVS